MSAPPKVPVSPLVLDAVKQLIKDLSCALTSETKQGAYQQDQARAARAVEYLETIKAAPTRPTTENE